MIIQNIAVLVSGGGTNLQALIDYKAGGGLKNGNLSCVISSNPEAYALKRAENNRIPAEVISRNQFAKRDDFESKLMKILDKYNIDLIILAGFMCILGDGIINKYRNRIINVHPSLIPSFCGKGYYGLRVHEAALEYGVKVTGATVHFVNEVTDGGAIILQKSVDIMPDDDAKSLQKRVMEQAEWIILPKAVELFCDGRIEIVGNKTKII